MKSVQITHCRCRKNQAKVLQKALEVAGYTVQMRPVTMPHLSVRYNDQIIWKKTLLKSVLTPDELLQLLQSQNT